MTIVVIGAGRMGQALAKEIEAAEDLTLVECRELADISPLPSVDVYIDFSHPANLPAVCQAAVQQHIPLVLGTTGLTDEDQRLVERTAQQTAVV